ncbi:OmpA family protein [Vibrio sp. ZSDZ34]|uniref:OmpA family protein n=1 Tax=Vibrio gelatinilyticus TaxID=2893468 RepID=A0A9X1W8C8_9VIBR|nr:OmpA family protein [Vibrio gelatinilyticus]MCJ2375336.1 OmpA family protein [Vibrio gelatinilyticus]
MDVILALKKTMIAISCLTMFACSNGPEEGRGGMAEQYTNSEFAPVMPDEPLGPEHGLRFDWKLAKLHLDTLVDQGAKWCFPAAVAQAEEKQNRIARELAGDLWIDAANDIVIQRKRLNDLELKLNYVLSQARCVPPRNRSTLESQLAVVKQIFDLLNVDNQFAFNSSEVNPKYMGHLAQAANLMKTYPAIELQVTGHADATGTEEYNERLALERAKQVKRYLMIFGLEEARISTLSLGSSLPLYDGDTPGIMLTNRRVSIEVIADEAELETAMRDSL